MSERRIVAYDILGRPHERPLSSFRFRISVYGILRRGRSILVHRLPKLDQFAIPGGGVELGETFASALSREFREETGLEVRPIRLLDVKESFFTTGREDAHGALILYEVEQIGGWRTPVGNASDSVEARFLPLDDLLNGQILPVFESFLRNFVESTKETTA